MSKIPLSVPKIDGNEWKYVKDCLDQEWVSSAGKYVDLFEKKICEYTKSKYSIACVNGTSAIQISLKVAGVTIGDEVIVPTLTFIAPVNAIIYNGAEPIFMDCDKFYNIDSEKVINFIKEKTIYKNGFSYNKVTKKRIKALLPVHVFGNTVNKENLYKLCFKRNIAIVEDASESLGSFYICGEDKKLEHSGTHGTLGCISFNGNKIITTGNGGMVLTDDEKIARKVKYLTTQAKDDSIRYIHNEVGYNFRLSNISSAVGVAQLEKLNLFLQKKKYINNFYIEKLKNIDDVEIAKSPKNSLNNHWLNILKIKNNTDNNLCMKLMSTFNKNDIETRPIWHLNHLQLPYKNYQKYFIENALKISKNSICIPSSVGIKDEELVRICNVIEKNIKKII